jgi:hypothetical protein
MQTTTISKEEVNGSMNIWMTQRGGLETKVELMGTAKYTQTGPGHFAPD